jgi:hypothetical protein
MKKKASKEPELINDYSRRKNEEGLKEVEEMLKQPLSLEQAKEQTNKVMGWINGWRNMKLIGGVDSV